MVLVLDAETLLKQEGQVVTLGEAGELGSIAQPNVDDCIHPGFRKEVNERSRVFGV